MGNRIYLADKPTLDKVDAATADTKGKVGTTVDVGGSASAGSVFGKLNAVIAYLLGYVTTSLANVGNHVKRLNDLFPDARVAKIDKLDAIDTNVTATKGSAYNAEQNSYQSAVNTATNNAASATGTISQKLSKVLADIASIATEMKDSQKRLASKWARVDLTSYVNKTVTVLNVSGAGVFRGAYTNNFSDNNCSNIRVTLDGTVYNLSPSSGSSYILGRSVTAENFPLMTAGTPSYIIPLPFKSGLKIELTLKSSVTSSPFTANYDVYE